MHVRNPKSGGAHAARVALAGIVIVVMVSAFAPAVTSAAVTTVGSPLTVPATLNTAEDLAYRGTDTEVPPSPAVPNGIVHTAHYGADTALWNVNVAGGSAAMPVAGQAVKVSLEGCAMPAPGGPAPLTQIHFQDLSPLQGGGARVNLSSQPFQIPVCGRGGASQQTVTTYEPVNLCVNQGDYVALNTEGGFVEGAYRAGVPYEVIGSVAGSSLASFIMGNGTGNGATLSALDSSPMEGFALTAQAEVMLQVTLGTGANARYVCPGGTKEAPPVLAPLSVHPQTDGINHERMVAVAIYCRLAACRGVATLTLSGRHASVGHTGFSLPGDRTSHVPIRVAPRVMTLIRAHHGVSTTLVAEMAGRRFTQTVWVKIF